MTAPATARQPTHAFRAPDTVAPRVSRRPPQASSAPRPPRRRGPTEVRPRTGHIPGLDGIRALAILGVLVFHFTPTVLPGGFLGVDVFFVVSGFLITTLLLRELSSRGRVNLPQFWLRRARRLLPALVTVVVVSVGAARLVGGDLLVDIGRQAFGALTFSTNWVEIAAGASYFHSTSPLLFVNFWSLAVEEQFYLFWPFLLVLLLALTRSTRQRLRVVGAAVIASAGLMALFFTPGEDATRVYYGTDTHLFGLMLGVGLALAWASPQRAWLLTAAWRRWRTLAVAAALGVLVLLMATLTDASAWTFRGGILLACVATTVLVAGLLEHPSGWRRAMETTPLTWLGQRSYGIYLWHWPVLMIAATLFPFATGTLRGWVVLTVALVVTLALSEASHRWIESPVRRLGFRAALRGLRTWVATPWETSRAPRITAGVLATMLLLAAVGAVTAPTKSETQQRIEAAEAELNGTPVEPVAKVPATDSTGGGGSGGLLGDVTGGLLDRVRSQQDEGKDGAPAVEQPDASADPAPAEQEDEATDPEPAPAGEESGGDHPWGYHVDDEGLLVPDGKDITAIGDSLVVTSADGLKYRFEGIGFAARSNRQWKDAMPVVEAALAEGAVRDNVIVHFGTNAGVDEEKLRAVLDKLGPDRRIVVMNLYSSSTFVPGSNEIIARVAKEYPNVTVGDWHAAAKAQPETLQSDRIHPDIAGMHVYARVVAESFDRLAREHAG
jgi:peptidoglycan/LPS O-acetylase OafA/YrhL